MVLDILSVLVSVERIHDLSMLAYTRVAIVVKLKHAEHKLMF
jgi:hypothetical protein